eukprot:jgi/Galph1/2143/GphlegSOOS_G793.1
MPGFSLRLLEKDSVRQWLMCRQEFYVPAHIIESAVGICGDTVYDGATYRFHFLMRPIGVVDNFLLGLKLGASFKFALPRNFDGQPLCIRFAVDLETMEKVEFHWFSNGTVLVDSMQFPTAEERIRYLVLFEAPAIGRLPSKLLRSTEVLSWREPIYNSNGAVVADGELHELNAATISLSLQEKNVFREGVAYMSLALGLFCGSMRLTTYDGQDSFSQNDDNVFPIETVIHVVRSATTEYLKALEIQKHSVIHPVMKRTFSSNFEMPNGKLKTLLENEHYIEGYRLFDKEVLAAAERRIARKKKLKEKRRQRSSHSSKVSSVKNISEYNVALPSNERVSTASCISVNTSSKSTSETTFVQNDGKLSEAETTTDVFKTGLETFSQYGDLFIAQDQDVSQTDRYIFSDQSFEQEFLQYFG